MVSYSVESDHNLPLPGPGRGLLQTCRVSGAQMEPDCQNVLAFGRALPSLPHLDQLHAAEAFIFHTYSQL